MGRGAEALGLTGQVRAYELNNLFHGYSPDGTVALVQHQKHPDKATHRPGLDLTFNAPKSVSVLWSQASPENRQAIQQAHFRAVRAGLSFIEESIPMARSGKGGRVAELGGLVTALFEHSTSRGLDPHLHTHAVLLNAILREDGRFSTINGDLLFRAKMAAGALYRVELAYQLELLGLSLRRQGSWFEIVGVSQDLMEFFSKRREAVEAELLRTGLESAQAAAKAALVTREAKEVTSRSNLFSEWQVCGRERNCTTLQADSLFRDPPQHKLDSEVEGARDRTIKRVTKEQAHFSEIEFIRYFAEEVQTRGLDAVQTREVCSAILRQSPDILPLGKRRGQEHFTTPEMLSLERRLLQEVKELDQNDFHQISIQKFAEFLTNHGELYEEQMKALYHITVDSGGIALVSGVAGAGKTYMLGIARELWESEGFEVFGTALSGSAVRQLSEGSGIKCQTIAKLLWDAGRGKCPLHEKSILVVDEAGMLDTATWERLTRLCNETGAKLSASGHESQLQPIGPGAPLPELSERHGVARLTQNRRQKDEWLQEVVGQMMEGKADPALKTLVSKGMVSIYKTKSEAISGLIRQWRDDGHAPEETLIIAPTHRDVNSLNKLAHQTLLDAGKLTGNPIQIGGEDFYVGDALKFTKTSGPRGIENGTRGTVVAIDRTSERVTVLTHFKDRITVSLRDFPHITRGYAVTAASAQGSTVEYAYLLPGGNMQDRELSYVQASRAKLQSTFHLTEIESGQAIAEFARQIKHSRQKEMAVSVERHSRLQRQDLEQTFEM